MIYRFVDVYEILEWYLGASLVARGLGRRDTNRAYKPWFLDQGR